MTVGVADVVILLVTYIVGVSEIVKLAVIVSETNGVTVDVCVFVSERFCVGVRVNDGVTLGVIVFVSDRFIVGDAVGIE